MYHLYTTEYNLLAASEFGYIFALYDYKKLVASRYEPDIMYIEG